MSTLCSHLSVINRSLKKQSIGDILKISSKNQGFVKLVIEDPPNEHDDPIIKIQ